VDICPFASIGQFPPCVGFKRQPSAMQIVLNTVTGEFVTMKAETRTDGIPTHVGDGGLFMRGAHVAHDCRVGNGILMADTATIASNTTLGISLSRAAHSAPADLSRLEWRRQKPMSNPQ
jgi:UDP-N-acetylglucosamine acyltransferase